MSGWFIFAQVMGIITIGLEIATYQVKDKVKFFTLSCISGISWTFMFIGIGLATGMNTQLSLIAAGIYNFARNGLFCWMFKQSDPQKKEMGMRVLLVMVAITLIAGYFTVMAVPPQVRWLHISGVIASVFFAISQYLPGVHAVRIGVVIVAILIGLTQTPINILDGDFRWNIMGLAIEGSKILAVIIFYIRYAFSEKKPQLQFAKPS